MPDDETQPFCCSGCRTVYALLHDEGLTRYYDLRGGVSTPVPDTHADRRDEKWLEPVEARIGGANGPVRVDLDVQGIQCTACVWLIEQLFRRTPKGLRVIVNPARGCAELLVAQDFPLRGFVREVERFGYVMGPPAKDREPRRDALLVRIGVCVALAMNTMIFALPIYFGLRAGVVYHVFRWVAAGLTTASVIVGGSVFFRAAWEGARRRVLHLDLPIALGIVLAYAGSLGSFLRGRDGAAYFDTLGVFIALMLTGRWLQERVLERNRRALLASDGLDSLLTRRITADRAETVPCISVREGDVLLVARGDLVPVDARLVSSAAEFSLDWIQGESDPRRFDPGATVPAGAFNAGTTAVRLVALGDFERSGLASLLQPAADGVDERARTSPWWQRFSVLYVLAVLGLASTAFVAWSVRAGGWRALEIATAILVVTCPCAFGIATPLAYELVQQGLRRAGLFVRRGRFLDRAPDVRNVVFDKTGTLTTGIPSITNVRDFDSLDARERDVLYTMVSSSHHPRSIAVRDVLERRGARFLDEAVVCDRPGEGLETSIAGTLYRFGAARWAESDGGDGVSFAVDGAARVKVETDEALRPDARGEVARLVRDGYSVWLLSGDALSRVQALASRLDVPRERAVGDCSPTDKEAWLASHDRHDTLMIGDGLNDALAVDRAFCSGTPAIDRPLMPTRTDFYFTTPGLHPIGLALRASKQLLRVHRRNLSIAIAYNAVTVSLAFGGAITPLLCAVLMPASSLVLLATTAASLSKGAALWRS